MASRGSTWRRGPCPPSLGPPVRAPLTIQPSNLVGLSMSAKKTPAPCFNCGAPSETRDHVPPKGVFPTPRPKQLITVPACRKCNNVTKLDDEYFRWLVATLGDQTASSDALINERILPRFKQNPALLHSIMQKSTVVDVFSPGGIWLERRPAFNFDRPRIQRVVEKIVRGLYFHEFGERLTDARVEDFVLNPDQLSNEDKEYVTSLPVRQVAPDVFSYRCERDPEDPRHSGWFLMFFYPKTLFFTMTTPA